MSRLCSVFVLCILAVFAVPVNGAARCPAGLFTGVVTYVRDGDTVEIGDMAIRFAGIAAPESNEPGGAKATAILRGVVLGKTVTCDLTGKPTHDRCVARCYLDGVDIEAEMVRLGVARDCPRYSGGRHAAAERAAAADGAAIRETYRLPDYCRPR